MKIYPKIDERYNGLESLKEYGYGIEYCTHDLYSEDVSDNIATEYEKKFVEKGIKINKLVATKKEN